MESVRGLEELEDGQLLAALDRLVAASNRVTAEVLAHIGEVDARGLYRDQACSSMFEYCVKRLHLSESAAYRRIHVARAARRLPVLREWLAAGRVHLSGLSMLVPHLDADNCEALLARAEHKSKRELEELVAELAPRPDIPSRVRKLPQPKRNSSIAATSPAPEPPPTSAAAPEPGTTSLVFAAASPVLEPSPTSAAAPESRVASAAFASAPTVAPRHHASVTALAPERYAVQFTAERTLRDKLETARELLRHQNPSGDLTTIVDRALDLLIEQLMNQRFGKTPRPRKTPVAAPAAGSRHIPRAVRRAVFARDEGRCTFTDENGRRCEATGFLEFHHREPFALGGAADVENIALLCRSHNALVAERELGREFVMRRGLEDGGVSRAGP